MPDSAQHTLIDHVRRPVHLSANDSPSIRGRSRVCCLKISQIARCSVDLAPPCSASHRASLSPSQRPSVRNALVRNWAIASSGRNAQFFEGSGGCRQIGIDGQRLAVPGNRLGRLATHAVGLSDVKRDVRASALASRPSASPGPWRTCVAADPNPCGGAAPRDRAPPVTKYWGLDCNTMKRRRTPSSVDFKGDRRS
jgi:hypothetical protein